MSKLKKRYEKPKNALDRATFTGNLIGKKVSVGGGVEGVICRLNFSKSAVYLKPLKALITDELEFPMDKVFSWTFHE